MEVKILELLKNDVWTIIGVHYTLRSVDDEIAVFKLLGHKDGDFRITDWVVNGYEEPK